MAIFNLKRIKSSRLKYLKVGKFLRWKEESDYSDLNRQKFSASEVICWNRQLQHCHSNNDDGNDGDGDGRGEICQCRQCRRQCKIFASGVNFSRNNAIYNKIESSKCILY